MNMAVTLGKRKRVSRAGSGPSSPSPPSPDKQGEQDVQAIFRRAFEARFKPLQPEHKKRQKTELAGDVKAQEEEDSDWHGLSSEDEAVEVVVEHSAAHITSDRASRNEIKAFMSSRPPSLKPQVSSARKNPKQGADEDDTETLNAQNDLALQRLIRESHLLETSNATSKFSPSGTNRHKALDLRLQALGAKKSILRQENMPMSHRKGIQAKAAQREDNRRKEARENGIILETATRMKKLEKRRERGVGGPSVGKFRGGTLSLSRRDLASIKGPVARRGRRGRR